MGSVRKASAWLGLVDDNDDERYYDDDYAPVEAAGGPQTGAAGAWTTDPRVRVASQAAQAQGRRIATIRPDGFRDARSIGELYREGVPVIMNLTDMEPDDAKRVVDFAAGLTFGLRGSIERVAARVFLLTPTDFQVVPGEAGRSHNGGFFNQS